MSKFIPQLLIFSSRKHFNTFSQSTNYLSNVAVGLSALSSKNHCNRTMTSMLVNDNGSVRIELDGAMAPIVNREGLS